MGTPIPAGLQEHGISWREGRLTNSNQNERGAVLGFASGYQALQIDGPYAKVEEEIAEETEGATAAISGDRKQLEEIRKNNPEVRFTYLQWG